MLYIAHPVHTTCQIIRPNKYAVDAGNSQDVGQVRNRLNVLNLNNNGRACIGVANVLGKLESVLVSPANPHTSTTHRRVLGTLNRLPGFVG